MMLKVEVCAATRREDDQEEDRIVGHHNEHDEISETHIQGIEY